MVFAYLKSMTENQFTGLLHIIRSVLQKPAAIKAIKKTWMLIKHRLKNINYSINKLVVNTGWTYEEQKEDETANVYEKHRNDHEQEDSWEEILKELGGEF